jgi:hypothetical protein
MDIKKDHNKNPQQQPNKQNPATTQRPDQNQPSKGQPAQKKPNSNW